ncbi:choline/carnitine/betaine transport [Desulfocicer vacuolatum DSM 3385]|uniref:Choline/carnitine/betaine transport n=1 Tax=Desulfocicer vacuolatum DSM 3385 TaxID=1121400 RepID=A0A1W2CL15_9BACT|nr:BCCT family transporter [Desulfocicer vacuolatum]SMC85684.1 choline/carnitine/betaine transport [Desulfocicer vacuolatum DSM 3385]
MAINSPLTELDINLADKGFYKGFNQIVTIGTKILIALLVIWAAVFSEQAGAVLKKMQGWSFESFGPWYIYAMAFVVILCLILAIYPAMGKIRLGGENAKPEFSTFSWFSMMFGAGVGIGMLTFSSAEPIYHFASNPDTIMGLVEPKAQETLRSVYKWSFFHWGLTAWGCYGIVGLVLAYFSYNRNLPLTIRSGLTPLFGKKLEGIFGDIVDITAVIATILGIAVTIGYGIAQFASGMHTVAGAQWMVNADGSPTNTAMLIALCVVMATSILSAASGVGKGIKWLSNLNMVLSFSLLAFFLIFGAPMVAIESLFLGIWDYIINFPVQAITYWPNSEVEPAATLYKWQSIWWTVFYWAWWISFAPFVGLFFARISRGRTIREYVLGTMVIPAVMCFIWFTVVGGTAIDLELTGKAGGSILGAGQEAQLFATLSVMLSPIMAKGMSFMVVILLITYLVTSADSGILVINTINAGGDDRQKGIKHIIFWGVALTTVIAVLLLAGGLTALKSAMLVGALPFSAIMVLMGFALLKALIRDAMRSKEKNFKGIPADAKQI